MPKEIEGVKLEASMGRRRKTRGQLTAERKKREKERDEKHTSLVENQEPLSNAINGLIVRHNNSVMVGNGVRSTQARGHQYAAAISPKKRLRYFLKEELSSKPDNNGRYAVMAGFSLTELPSTFIAGFSNRLAAETACLLAYKEGTYIKVVVADRGPGFNYQTVHKIRRA